MASAKTEVCSKRPLIKLDCARIRLWSDLPDRNDLWSDLNQTMVQTIECSNRCPDPVILVWEHTGGRSNESDHSSIWVLTSTWIIIGLQADEENILKLKRLGWSRFRWKWGCWKFFSHYFEVKAFNLCMIEIKF